MTHPTIRIVDPAHLPAGHSFSTAMDWVVQITTDTETIDLVLNDINWTKPHHLEHEGRTYMWLSDYFTNKPLGQFYIVEAVETLETPSQSA